MTDIPIDKHMADHLLGLLEEDCRAMLHCAINKVGDEKMWVRCIARNRKLMKKLSKVK